MGQPPYRLAWISHLPLPSLWENNQHSILSQIAILAWSSTCSQTECSLINEHHPRTLTKVPPAYSGLKEEKKPFGKKHFECLLKPKWVRGAILGCRSHLGLWASWACATAHSTTFHTGSGNPQEHSWWAHPSACSASLCIPAPSDLL